jgi:hypothetical protein
MPFVYPGTAADTRKQRDVADAEPVYALRDNVTTDADHVQR